MAVNFRLVVMFVSVGMAILCGITLAFIVTAVTEYRAKDFFTASSMEDFSTLGTCVEALTDKQLKWQDYHDPHIYCGVDRATGNRGHLRNSLAVSVHGLYYTKFAYGASAYKETVPATYLTNDVEAALNATVSAVITATVGGSDHEKAKVRDVESGGQYHSGRFPRAINFTTAYLALHYVAQQQLPTSCDEIYGLTSGTIQKNEVGQIEFINAIRQGKYEAAYELGPDIPVKESWPLHEIAIDCNYNETVYALYGEKVPFDNHAPGTYELDVSAKKLTNDQIKLLHAHCYAQYEYASVGTIQGSGTWMIPLPGIDAGPKWLPWWVPQDFRSNTTTYSEKTRGFLGYRFGLSLIAYVPIFLTTCILLSDAIVFFVSEITMPVVLDQMNLFYEDRLSQIRDSLVIAATTKTSRLARGVMASVALAACGSIYYAFIVVPWGFWYQVMPRPICEGGEEDEGSLHFGFWLQTYGGWKSDWETLWYEVAVFFCLLLVTVAIPASTSKFAATVEGNVDGGTEPPGRLYAEQVSEGLELVHNKAEYRDMKGAFTWILYGGTLAVILSQALPSAQFGWSWLLSVTENPMVDIFDSNGMVNATERYDSVQLAEFIYDQAIATFAATAACGLVLGAMLQRHLFGGVGCMSTLSFFLWVALIIVFALPLFTYGSIRSIFDVTSAGYDCVDLSKDGAIKATLQEGGLEDFYGVGVCNFRTYAFLGASILFSLGVAAITFQGLVTTISLLSRPRIWAEVPYEDGGLAQAPKIKSRFFREGPANNVAAPLMQGVGEEQLPLGAYRSSNTFFNFKTTRTDSDAFLYAPRMRTPTAR